MAEPIHSAHAPAPIGPYSQAIRANDELFVSGMIALDPHSGQLLEGDAAAQADRALQSLGAILSAAGMNYGNVVKTTIFLIDMNDFNAVNDVYARYFDANKPARSTIAVSGLPKGARVEIDAIAKA